MKTNSFKEGKHSHRKRNSFLFIFASFFHRQKEILICSQEHGEKSVTKMSNSRFQQKTGQELHIYQKKISDTKHHFFLFNFCHNQIRFSPLDEKFSNRRWIHYDFQQQKGPTMNLPHHTGSLTIPTVDELNCNFQDYMGLKMIFPITQVPPRVLQLCSFVLLFDSP